MRKEGLALKLFRKPEAKNALLIGVLCAFSYIGVYLMRHMLGAATPNMVETGAATREYLAVMASLYSIVYAAGNLVNGFIGERVKAKYLSSGGLLLGGIGMLALPFFIPSIGAYAVYGVVAFCLSSVYNPLIKLIAENTEAPYTERCSIGFTVSSFLGSPLAGLLAAFLVWQWIFRVTGLILVSMGAACFVSFLWLERQGILRYGRFSAKKGGKLRIRALLEHDFIRFLILAVFTGIVRTSVVFWTPTYLVEYLHFEQTTASLLYSGMTVAFSASTLLSIIIYEHVFGSQPRRTYLSFFCVGTISFLAAAIIRQPVVNVVFFTLALLANGCGAGLLYCQYCPTLKDTGMVSAATGFMTGMSYVGSSLSTSLFGFASGAIGWRPLVLVWAGMMLIGGVAMLPVFDYKKKEN